MTYFLGIYDANDDEKPRNEIENKITHHPFYHI